MSLHGNSIHNVGSMFHSNGIIFRNVGSMSLIVPGPLHKLLSKEAIMLL